VRSPALRPAGDALRGTGPGVTRSQDPVAAAPLRPALAALVRDLDRAGPVLSRRDALALLGRAELTIDDVRPFVRESPHGYARVRVARTDAYELLVMTWRAGQGSIAHDHAGSICALRVIQGRVNEDHFRSCADGLVEKTQGTVLAEGEVIVDRSADIHALTNDATSAETLVTLHLYAPPLPELRRYAPRSRPGPARAYLEARELGAPIVGIVGGGFSGTLVASHLVREASRRGKPVHVALLDPQATFGEGAAYRTPDPHHLLNVPAAGMSALPDRPDDFLAWSRRRDPEVAPYDFLPRKRYGEYLRDTLLDAADAAPPGVTLEFQRVLVDAVRREDARWTVMGGGRRVLSADVLVLATGHRPPADPLAGRWTGSRAHFVEDPWATLVLSAIRPDETVVLLGTGLTAVDVVLSITKSPRSAPIYAVSRRGLLPAGHAPLPVVREDPSPWLAPLLARGPTARTLLAAVRAAARRTQLAGGDWRSVIDGLRPHTTPIWQSLGEREARRFLRHVRPHWEVHRHRMAPSIAAQIEGLQATSVLRPRAARFVRADATSAEVRLEIQPRGGSTTTVLRADWVVNCTGPGSGPDSVLSPALRSLVDAAHLELDPFGLGVLTDELGRARARGVVRSDLLVVGTLRKAQLWESTAVPELRAQAAGVASAIASRLGW